MAHASQQVPSGGELNHVERLVLFEEYGERCVWCRRPLEFASLEVDHLIPKNLTGADLADVLVDCRLPSDFEIHSLENLVPSCGPCNRDKGSKPLPGAPKIVRMLETARMKAPTILQRVASFNRRQRLGKLIGIISEIPKNPSPEELKLIGQLRVALGKAADDPIFEPAPILPLQLVNLPRLLCMALDKIYKPKKAALEPSTDRLSDDGLEDDEQMLELLQDWARSDRQAVIDVVEETFNDGSSPVESAFPTGIKFLAYSTHLDDFLARVTFDVDYLLDMGVGDMAEAFTSHSCDLWVKLDTEQLSVVDVVVDTSNSLDGLV